IRKRVTQLGGSLDPHACYLLHRGLKTLAVRVARQNQTASVLAQVLNDHPEVTRVNYAGLPSSPSHSRAAKYLDGFGGMLSFEIEGDGSAVTAFMRALEIPVLAPSLGSVETLIVQPAQTSHVSLSPEERAAAGVTDGLVRVSVGIESVDDLVADFVAALNTIRRPAAV
ncbi:MAG: PLP-dependent transferase, partial [Rhodothermia bacterium]|nr:PLP-dependent transferase [Rhodothermia bacterium]